METSDDVMFIVVPAIQEALVLGVLSMLDDAMYLSTGHNSWVQRGMVVDMR